MNPEISSLRIGSIGAIVAVLVGDRTVGQRLRSSVLASEWYSEVPG
jgi:hypothetical protein